MMVVTGTGDGREGLEGRDVAATEGEVDEASVVVVGGNGNGNGTMGLIIQCMWRSYRCSGSLLSRSKVDMTLLITIGILLLTFTHISILLNNSVLFFLIYFISFGISNVACIGSLLSA